MSLLLKQIVSSQLRTIVPVGFITQVRHAKVIKRPDPANYRLSDAALWRKARGLDHNPNKFGPLTNLPDYSYLDGRPVPLSLNLKRRLEKQKEYAETIVRMSGELDWARENYKQRVAEAQALKQQIIDSKLRPKGAALSTSNSHKKIS